MDTDIALGRCPVPPLTSKKPFLWPIYVIGYSCFFVYKAIMAILREAIQGRLLNSPIKLRNAMFASASSTWVHCINGDHVQHRDGEWYKCFTTNGFDYLAMPHQDPVHYSKRVYHQAIADFEGRFAQYVGADSGILFVSGFLANVEMLRGLGQIDKTLFLWDSACHRSAIEGIRDSSNSSFKHNNMKSLEALLELHKDDYKHIWVMVEGIYSMSGDVPDYKELKRLRAKHEFKLIVDRAHSFIFDYASASHASSSDLEAELSVLSFSKSGGIYGGFVFGKHEYIDIVRNHASEESISYPLTLLNLLASVMDAFEDGTVAVRTKTIKELSACAYDYLVQSGWMVLSPRGSHIIIVQMGIGYLTCAMQQWCIQHGVYFGVIGYPAIASRFNLGFRICITASMTNEQLHRMVQTMNSNPFAKNPALAVPSTRDMVTIKQALVGGMKAARNLGGTSLETKETEAALARALGFDRCIYCADTALALKYWRKLFSEHCNTPVYFAKSGLEEVVKAREDGHSVVVCPVKPFGCVMLCGEKDWRDYFHVMHPSFVFTTAIPPFIWNPFMVDACE